MESIVLGASDLFKSALMALSLQVDQRLLESEVSPATITDDSYK